MENKIFTYLKKSLRRFTEYPLVEINDQDAINPPNQIISPVVYQTWINNKFGQTHSKQIIKFRNLNKNLSFKIFDDLQIDKYMELNWGNHSIFEVYKNALIGPLRTDIFRYCILYERGGYYFDISRGCDLPLTKLHSQNDEAVITFEDTNSFIPPGRNSINLIKKPFNHFLQWGLCFKKKHKILKMLIDSIVENYPFYKNKIFSNPKLAILNFTGPGNYTKIVRKYIEENGLQNISQLDIKFNGHGIFKLEGSSFRYNLMPSYTYLKDKIICK